MSIVIAISVVRMSNNKKNQIDSEFTNWLDEYIDQMLQIHKMAKPAPRTIDVWKCKSLGDFMCGFFVGEMIGTATATFQTRYRRGFTADEHTQITNIVEKKSVQIRDAFLKYNRQV